MKNYGMTKHDNIDMPSTPFYKQTYECKEFSYCIFASDNIINGIISNIPIDRRHYLMDATFKVVPFSPFRQLLIIYVEYRSNVNAIF